MATTLQSPRFPLYYPQTGVRPFRSSSRCSNFKKPSPRRRPGVGALFLPKSRVPRSASGRPRCGSVDVPRSGSGEGRGGSVSVESHRPAFDLNLAVVLAGFAFEAYISPPENVGWREMDAAECQTVFLSEMFLREVYNGQVFIMLKKGVNFPALDLWGTSDPYVVLQLNGQVAKKQCQVDDE